MNAYKCCFCKGNHLDLEYNQQFHPFNQAIGGYDIYVCRNCGSAITNPVPDKSKLALLYNSFQGGIQPRAWDLRTESPLYALYQQLLKRALRRMKSSLNSDSVFSWIDIGAGDGILSKMIIKQYPHSKGIAVDFHEKPEMLEEFDAIKWVKVDLNEDNLSLMLDHHQFDLVISLAVLEHVQDPSVFIDQLLPLVDADGVLYIACPDYSSAARKLMKRKWPYYIPGEHINIPSIKGIDIMLANALSIPIKKMAKVYVKRIWVAYPLKYFFNYFGMKKIGKLISSSLVFKLPVGALEAVVINHK